MILTFFIAFSSAASAAPNVRCDAAALPTSPVVENALLDLTSRALPAVTAEPQAGPQIDAKDLATIESRKNWLELFFARFRAKAPELVDTDGDIESKLAFLNKNQAFRRFFKAQGSVAHGLEERNDPFDAQIKFVEDQAEGLQAKLELIRQAKHTIDLTYFIFAPDESGLAVLHVLKEAVRRGVRVRLLIDGIGSLKGIMAGNPHLKAFLKDAAQTAGFMIDDKGQPTKIKATAEVVIFNPISRLQFGGVNRRSHDKILITDAMYPTQAMAMLGGRNIADHYYQGVDGPARAMIDYEIIVKNMLGSDLVHERDIGKVLNDYFERLYFHDANRLVTRDILENLWGRDELAAMAAAVETVGKRPTKFSLNDDFHPEQFEFVSTIQNLLRRRVLKNFGAPDRIQAPVNGRSLTRRMRELFLQSSIVEAQTGKAEHATIVSPYLTLSPNEMKLMIKWLKQNRGRKLTMVTSSILTNNHLMSQVLVDDGLAKFTALAKENGLSDQIEVFCYGRLDDKAFGGPRNYGTLHEKTFLLEQARVSAVMTYNFEPRSQVLNSESGAFLRGEVSYSRRATHVEGLLTMSAPYGSSEWQEMRNRATGHQAIVVKFQSRYYRALRALGLWYMI